MHRSLKQLYSAVFLSVATLATGIASPSAAADTYSHYEPNFLRKAERALLREDGNRALEILREVGDQKMKTRHRAEAHGLACRAHLKLENPIEARESCQTAIETLSNRGAWRHYNNLGVAELQLGNYEAAEQAFAKASSLSGWASTPRKNLALVSEIREARDSANGERYAGGIR